MLGLSFIYYFLFAKHHAESFRIITSLHPSNTSEIGIITPNVLKIRELKPKDDSNLPTGAQ